METLFYVYLAGTLTGFGLFTMIYGLFKIFSKKSDKEV